MRPFLLFAPYVLIPLILTLIWKKLNFKITDWIYLFTFILVFFYPFFVFWTDDLINPPPPGPRSGTPEIAFFLGSLIILMPASLILQFVFNKILLANEK